MAVVVLLQHLAGMGLQVVEVEDHPALVVALDDHIDPLGVAVDGTAFGVAGEEVGAVDVLGDAQAHGGCERTAERVSP